VIELYDRDVDTSFDEVLQKYYNGIPTTYSSFSQEDPVVLTKTYTSLFSAKAMSATVTQQGITRKDLLLLLNSG
jgi:hypothetical protein